MFSSRNELDRLKILWQCNILNSASDPEYDKICALTARILKTPYSFIEIFDSSQVWYKSCFGCQLQSHPKSMVTNTILQLVDHNDVVVVNEIGHAFFEEVMAYTGYPKIEFYATAPILLNGFVIGALTVADHTLRNCSVVDKMNLLDFSHSISVLLTQRRSNKIWNSINNIAVTQSLTSALKSNVNVVIDQITSIYDGLIKNQLDYDEEEGDKDNKKKVLIDHVNDAKISITQMKILVDSTPYYRSMNNANTSNNTDLSTKRNNYSKLNNVMKLLKYVQSVTPMLVGRSEITWDFDVSLKDVYVDLPEIMFSILISLLAPLTPYADTLHIHAIFKTYHKAPVKHSESKKTLNMVLPSINEIIELGKLVIIIQATGSNTSSDKSLKLSLLNAVHQESEQIIKESLIAMSLHLDDGNYGQLYKSITNNNAIEYSFAIPVQSVKKINLTNGESAGSDAEGEGNDPQGDQHSRATTPVMNGTNPHDKSPKPKLAFPVTSNVSDVAPVPIQHANAESKDTAGPQSSFDTIINKITNLNILVVDDCPMIQKVMTRFLKTKNCEVTNAENGQIGLNKLQECILNNRAYDIVFMDFLMPVMDGLECMTKFHEWRKSFSKDSGVTIFDNTMIVGLSATANEQDRLQGYQVGMHYFFVKPANVQLLQQLLTAKLNGDSISSICNMLVEAASNLKK